MLPLARSIAVATALLLGTCTFAAAAADAAPAIATAPNAPAAASAPTAPTAANAASGATPGAATSAEPGSVASAPRRPSILVVFDIDMEVSAELTAPAAVQQSRDAARRQAYDAITRRLAVWAEQQGVAIDTALFSKGKKVDMAGRSVSHLLVEKITQAAIDGKSTDGGPRIDTRKWKASAYDTSNAAAKAPKMLGSEDFISDGPDCFAAPAKAADDECRADYLRRLTLHLRWIDLSWGEVEPAPH